MLDEKTIRSLAAGIEQARKTHELARPVSAQFPEATIEDAYAIQRAWVAIRLAEGHRVLGRKIGLTSKAMQSQSSVKEPDYGCLLDDTIFADGAEIPEGLFTAPRVEVELAFILSKRLRGPGCTIFDVLNATDFLIPSLEILDLRLHRVDLETGKTRTIVDSIADNAGNAGLVTGGRPFKPHEADLRWVAALCFRNGADRGVGRRGRRARAPGERHRLARQQARCARRRSRARANRAQRILHPHRRSASRRHVPHRFRALRLGLLSL